MSSQMLESLAPSLPEPVNRGRQWLGVMALLAFGDALSIAMGFYLAYALRFWSNWAIFREGAIQPSLYLTLIAVLVPACLVLFKLYGLYDPNYLFGGSAEYTRAFNACTFGMVLVVVVTFVLPDVVVARAWLLLSWLLTVVLTIAHRFFARRTVYAMRRRGQLTERVIVVGANGEGRAVAAQLCASYRSGAQIIGFVDDDLPVGTEVLPGTPVLGPVSAFQSLVHQHNADAVIIADTTLVRERMPAIYGAIETLGQINVWLSPGLFELLNIGVKVREQGSVPLLALNKTRITGLHAISKATIDFVGALCGLILLSPLLLAIAIVVRLDSPGPIIHRRRVVGVGNRLFDAYKFRTMYVDGDARLTPEQRRQLSEEGKLKDDPRVTRVGRFLRRTSLDELPQLVNVLRGQMSLVGPRMITQEELRHFGRLRHNLLMVRPGLTGLWQISGRSDLGYEDRVRLDMHYIRNYSLWLDLYIIYRTIPMVLRGRGAY